MSDDQKKIAESDIFYIPVAHRTIDIPLKYDYMAKTPEYLDGDDWWHIEVDAVHVEVQDSLRRRFVELMEKSKAFEYQFKESEECDLKKCVAILNTLSETAANRAYGMMVREDIQYGKKEKKEYRTKAKADNVVDKLPSSLAVITNEQYQDGLSLRQGGGAYLQPLASTDGLQFRDGCLFFRGLQASEATLRDINRDNKDVPIEIDSIDLPLLRVFYSIILTNFEEKTKKLGVIDDIIDIYVPDLAALMGKSRNLNKKDIENIRNKTASFQSIYGILKDPKRPNGIGTAVPLLVMMGYYEESNTIRFASPYMTELIKRIYNVSIRKSRQGVPMLKKDGTPMLVPSHSYLVKSSIAKEKNKKAVEIVITVVKTIERAGSNTPHLRASTILASIPQLQKAYENAPTASKKNRVLERAFKKAWELLRTQTTLQEKYPSIVLPDPYNPKNIPTTSTLDSVYSFPHDT